MIEFNPGQLVRLCRPQPRSGGYYDVSVFIYSENGSARRELYPINTIGMIVEKGFKGNPGVYQVLIDETVVIVSDTFLKLFDPDEIIVVDIDDLEFTESVTI